MKCCFIYMLRFKDCSIPRRRMPPIFLLEGSDDFCSKGNDFSRWRKCLILVSFRKTAWQGCQKQPSALSLNGTLVCTRVYIQPVTQVYTSECTVANTEAVIRGSYKELPSTSTCQLTTCHRRCEVETKAASSTSIEHLCIFVLSSSDVCIVEQRREAGAFLRGVPTNKQQSHPLWRLAQSWGTLFKKVCFWDSWIVSLS